MNDQAFCPDCGCARRSGTVACANCGRSLEPVAESLEPAGAPASGWTRTSGRCARWWSSSGGAWGSARSSRSSCRLPTWSSPGCWRSGSCRATRCTPSFHCSTDLFPWGVCLGPIGVVVAGRSAGIRGAVRLDRAHRSSPYPRSRFSGSPASSPTVARLAVRSEHARRRRREASSSAPMSPGEPTAGLGTLPVTTRRHRRP